MIRIFAMKGDRATPFRLEGSFEREGGRGAGIPGRGGGPRGETERADVFRRATTCCENERRSMH